MGKRRRLQEEAEAQALRRRRRVRLGAFFILLAFVLVGYGYLKPSGKGSPSEEERVLRLAAERSTFIFCSHLDALDFALMEPFLEESFQAAGNGRRRVVFIEELGGLGPLADKATSRPPSPSVQLERIGRDPIGTQAAFCRSMASQQRSGRRLLNGELLEVESYEGHFGPYTKALHTFLARNHLLLAGTLVEDLSWEDHVEGLRLDVLQGRALDAFERGDPDEYERLMRDTVRRRDLRLASRDRNLMLQIGGILDRHPDLVVVTTRGIGHWGMVERFGLNARRPDWAVLCADDYGLGKIEMFRLMGQPLEAEGERKAILDQAVGRTLEGWLLATGRCRTDREAALLVKATVERPDLTVERLKELSVALGRGGVGKSAAEKARFVSGWLRERGFLD